MTDESIPVQMLELTKESVRHQYAMLKEQREINKKLVRDSYIQTKALRSIAASLEKLLGNAIPVREISPEKAKSYIQECEELLEWFTRLNDSGRMTCPIDRVEWLLTDDTDDPTWQLYFNYTFSKESLVSLRKEIRRLMTLDGMSEEMMKFYIHGKKADA